MTLPARRGRAGFARACGSSRQGFDGAGGQLGKRVVGGGEDGEGTFTLERVDQAGGLHGGDQGGEAAGGDGGVDDVLAPSAQAGLGRLSRRQEDAVDDVDDAIAG